MCNILAPHIIMVDMTAANTCSIIPHNTVCIMSSRHICMHIHIYIHKHKNVFVSVCVCECVCVCVRACADVHVYICIYMHT